MKLLPDTQILIWAANSPDALPDKARDLLNNPDSEVFFSSASLWEVAIKFSLNRPDFQVDPRLLHQGLVSSGYQELAVSSRHAIAVSELPGLHKDPFDRLLIAQARVEGVTLLTCDAGIAAYPGPILFAGKPDTVK
ncbi:MAG: type II toxin-antitoxin system VapC family toxin [Deltaproteobacteria bacterium]|jgi:PIN domain nuclease of toxin-antitoxin system|nr:type II toxin-antitoxin system VapC family toxin [Deltaproteobacteria bacterium]